LNPTPEVGPPRLQARRGLLGRIERFEKSLQNNPATRALGAFHEQALRIVTSPVAKRALDLEREPPAVRDRYGRNPYGDCFLLSRRLVEAGVRLVSFNWIYFAKNGRTLNLWDNHGGTAEFGGVTGYAMLKADYGIPPLDRGLAALLQDLKDRGLLDETMILVMGEFGRTPKINKSSGRDHWGASQSVVMAGGGIRGGQVYGATDKQAAFVKDKPVRPEDLLATVYHGFGLSADHEVHDKEGRPHRISDGKPLMGLFS
jgi:hypothetical protein